MQLRRFKQTGIFAKMFITSFLMMVIIIGIFAALTIPRQRNAILKSIEAQANGISASIAQVCANAIASGDYGFIVEHNLQAIQGNPHILYIIVANRNGFSLIHTAQQWQQRDTPDPQWRLGTGDAATGQILFSDLVQQKVFHYAFPLKYSIASWGWLYLGISLQDFDRESSTMYAIMSLLTIFCLITGLFGAYAFAQKLTRPIRALRQITNDLAQGDLSVRAQIATGDEIEELGAAFNQMAENLEKTTVSKDFVNNILATMTESLVVTTAAGTIQMVNHAALKLLGYAEGELQGQPLSILFTTEEAARPQWLERLLANGLEPHCEKNLRTKTGEPIPVLFSAAVMQHAQQIQGLVGVALDIRERKIGEENLRQAYKELKDTQAQLVQTAKLASIGQLSAGVAHELNQPLMVIRTTIQFLLRTFKQQHSLQNIAPQLESVERNTQRMMNIIDHLRTFSRQSRADFGEVEINRILEEAFDMIAEQLRLRNIAVQKDFAPALPIIKGNGNQLEQVFLNLIANAGDAITEKRESGGRIHIRTRVSAFSPQALEILIQDNGAGIPAENLENIFDPFFTTKDVGRGTGLGLSISYGIIKEHRGEIRVVETGAQGTTFTIRLPIET